ncbi:Segregation and condensation protein B [Planctomycetes bacterium MalM25]|nr:Segregation and condensation protein B [Planctomycetes bacterium MalM25]
MSDPDEAAAPLSANRLRAAFARMFGKPGDDDDDAPIESVSPAALDAVTPEGVVEALLFVGRPEGEAIDAERLASAIRDTTPDEIGPLVEQLNQTYERDSTAWRIEGDDAGYRLVLVPEMEHVQERMRGKVRASQLSPQALEALSVIAYRQPIDSEGIEELCGESGRESLRRLEKLGLVRRDEAANPDGPKAYATTDRFLRTLGLASVDQLPRVAELDD